jgi:hypothetical protein
VPQNCDSRLNGGSEDIADMDKASRQAAAKGAALVEQVMRDGARTAEKGFAEQVWGLSLFAQAELDNGDIEGAQKTLVRIAEVAAAMSANQ